MNVSLKFIGALYFRNVLIVMSYPFRFAIYCGMSQQFREVVRSMLTEKVFFPCDKKAKDFGRPGRTRPTNDTTQFSDDRKYAFFHTFLGLLIIFFTQFMTLFLIEIIPMAKTMSHGTSKAV